MHHTRKKKKKKKKLLNNNRVKIALISGGFSYFAFRVASRLGIDYPFSNTLGTSLSLAFRTPYSSYLLYTL
jgi:phosphoserine phosphatase